MLNAYIAEKELIKASQILKAEKVKDFNDTKLDQIELALGKENFRINYYETRIATIKEGTKTIAEYEWDGNAKTCKQRSKTKT